MVSRPNPRRSPNIPPRQSGDDHAKAPTVGKDKVPWPVMILFVLAVLIIAIITVLQRGRKTTKAPVQLSQVEILPAPGGDGRAGGAVYLDALLHNGGTRAITEVEVSATFVENNGNLKTIAPLLVENMPDSHSHDLVSDPIKPNESRRVRIYVEEPPTAWNHQPPQITVELSGTMPP